MLNLKHRIVLTDEILDHLGDTYNNLMTSEEREKLHFHHFVSGWIRAVDDMIYHSKKDKVGNSWKSFLL